MNLELLDPFGRQIPDRVDATLPLAPHLHFRQANHHLLAATLSSPNSTTANNKKGNKGENNEQQPRHSNSTNVNSIPSNSGPSGTGLNETGGTIPGFPKREVPEWRAAYHVSYNRRGTYLAVEYGSGAVAIHSTNSRTLAALYRSSTGEGSSGSTDSSPGGSGGGSELLAGNGVTSVSWSRRSRTLLTGAAGDAAVQLFDTTHSFGPEEAGLAIDDRGQNGDENEFGPDRNNTSRPRPPQIGTSEYENQDHIPPIHSKERTETTLFADPVFDELKYIFVKDRLQLESVNVPLGTKVPPYVKESFVLPTDTDDENDEGGEEAGSDDNNNNDGDDHTKKEKKRKKKKRKKKRPGSRDTRLNKHPCLSFSFRDTQAVGGSLQINPRCPTGGLAALMDGSLVVFWFDPEVSWITQVEPKQDKKKDNDPENEQAKEDDEGEKEGVTGSSKAKNKAVKRPPKYAIVVPLWSHTSKHFITCAAFDPQGERVYAATKDGTLLGFEVKFLFESLAASSPNHKGPRPKAPPPPDNCNVVESPLKGGLPLVAPHFKLEIPGGASAWHLLVSRNGKYLVLNSSDGALRLYSTKTCWTSEQRAKSASFKSSTSTATQAEKPTWTFQDVVSKVKFVSCDLSGDGEYVVGGANGNDNRYELSIWNTTTGNLMDKLTGPSVQLYSVAWHPTRASLAVATSDGLVDVWGPKMNWTAFAPDFQALHKNIVYEEEDGYADDEKETTTPMEVDTPTTKEVGAEGQSNTDIKEGPSTSKNGQEKPEEKNSASKHAVTKACVDKHNETMTESSTETGASDSAMSSRKTQDGTAAKKPDASKENNGHESSASVCIVNGGTTSKKTKIEDNDKKTTTSNDNVVDVLTIDPVPMFASDSEEEYETFSFETRVKNLFHARFSKFPKESRNED